MKRYSFKRRRIEKFFEGIIRKIKLFKYRNICLLMLSILLAYYILKPGLQKVILGFPKLGYVGTFLAGIFYSSTLTVAPATALLYISGKVLSPFLISVIGACGAVTTDYILFKFVKESLVDEVKKLGEELNSRLFYKFEPLFNIIFAKDFRLKLFKFSRSRKWKYVIPLVSAAIIASPLPDELGVAILGATNYEKRKFILLSYFSNFIGILFISYFGAIF
jgi:uncharacterized membrane protein YdjX (TVP38/TMEM64 family)